MDKISIIVPCYNVENLIDRCVSSITAQTIGINNLEILLINDASTDDTLSHLYEWEKKYPESIMVITYDKNIRQGGARNVGLQYASGEFIGFIDSDDWIEPEMYETLYFALINNSVDVSQCKFIRDDGFNNETDCSSGKEMALRLPNNNGLYWGNYDEHTDNGIYGGIVTRLFRKEIIYSHDIWFPESTAYEDNYWSGLVKLYTSSICLVDRAFYHYCVNHDSTTLVMNQTHHFDRLDIEVALLEEYKRRGAFDTFYDQIMLDFIQRYYLNTYHILFTRFTAVPDVYRDLRNVVFSYFPDWVERFNHINKSLITNNKMLTILASEENCSVENIFNAYLADHSQSGQKES